MKNYTTLIFDAFDTLIRIEREKLPRCTIGGRTIHTTAADLHPIYEDEAGPVDFERFVDVFFESFLEADRRRAADFRETSSADRFRIMIGMLGHDAERMAPGFPDRLAACHMERLEPALRIPDENRRVLDWAAEQGYRIAMISNFDHTPTIGACLDRHGVRGMFASVVVSEEIGWRKPHPEIFRQSLAQLGVVPGEALFVGDRLDLDVDGAAGAGMDVVWIDTGRQTWTPQHARPQHTIRALPELIPILKEV